MKVESIMSKHYFSGKSSRIMYQVRGKKKTVGQGKDE